MLSFTVACALAGDVKRFTPFPTALEVKVKTTTKRRNNAKQKRKRKIQIKEEDEERKGTILTSNNKVRGKDKGIMNTFSFLQSGQPDINLVVNGFLLFPFYFLTLFDCRRQFLPS